MAITVSSTSSTNLCQTVRKEERHLANSKTSVRCLRECLLVCVFLFMREILREQELANNVAFPKKQKLNECSNLRA